MVSSTGLTDQQALQLRPRFKVKEERAQEGLVLPSVLPAPITLAASSTSPPRMLSSSPMVLGSSLGSPTSPLSRSISNPPPFVDEDCAVPVGWESAGAGMWEV